MLGSHRDYAPLASLKQVAQDIWIVDGASIGFGIAGLRFPFPTRMTVVRLPDGGLWLHSPIAWDAALDAALDALGPVRHLIAPNTLHYWYLPEWAERHPGATVHLVPGLPEKARRPLPDGRTLEDSPPPEWGGALEQILLCGDVLNEADFFHRASGTLILTELIENFEPRRLRPWPLGMLIRWAGAADPDGSAPIDMRLTFRRHRAAVRAAVERMVGWAPERVLVAHGRCYLENGTAELMRAFRWAL